MFACGLVVLGFGLELEVVLLEFCLDREFSSYVYSCYVVLYFGITLHCCVGYIGDLLLECGFPVFGVVDSVLV